MKAARCLLDDGVQVTPNVVTFNCLMSACMRAGRWDEAVCVFESMLQVRCADADLRRERDARCL